MHGFQARYLLAGSLSLLLTATLLAQNTNGTIVGHVKDSSGASIVGARVSVVETDTKETRSVVTNGGGDYTVPLLKPGLYSVTVQSSSFTTGVASGISLSVDQTVRADVALTVGSTSESVNVSAGAVALDTDSPSVGEVIGGKLIGDLPLNGRNFQDLLITTPGAVNNGGGEQGTQRIVISGDGNSSIGIGGARGASNGYTVDGTSIIDVGEQSPAFQPSLDDIDEFKVQSKVYSAAYGFNANQVTLSSKSGTNAYHGSGFEYLRNNYVDATPHGSTPGVTISTLKQNQFGYSFGGPLRIPKLYDGRDKTFFFANYEGFRQTVAGNGAVLVPDLTELGGTFTQAQLGTVRTGGARTQCGHTYNVGDPLPLFDPTTGCPFAQNSDGSYTIPSTRISAIGKLAQRPGLYFPATGPTITSAGRGLQNYSINAPTTLQYNQQNYRIDQNLGHADSIFFHAVKHDETQLLGRQTPASSILYVQPARFYSLTETHTFSPTFTNQFRFGYVEAGSGYHEPLGISAADLSSLNFPSPYQLALDGYPRLLFQSAPQNDGIVPDEVSYESPVSHLSSTFDAGDSAYKVLGRHSLNFGVQLRRTHYSYLIGGGLGYFVFNGQYSGDDIADLLLGSAAGINTVQVGPLANATTGSIGHLRLTTWAGYLQDDWKVTPDLTLNLGLRYEHNQIPYEEQGLMFSPDFSAPQGAIYVGNKSIVSQYAGTNPFGGGGLYVNSPNKGTFSNGKNNSFAPRVGFAFRPFDDNKTVLRGGYGFFYDSYEFGEVENTSNFYPLSSGVSTPGSTVPLTYPAVYSMDRLPAASANGPVVSLWDQATQDTNPNSPLGFIGQVSGPYSQPSVEDWVFGVERELPFHTTLEVDYVGNKMTHLLDRQNPNQPSLCNAATACTVDAGGPTVSTQARRPYKNLGVMVNAQFNGYGNYNALDVKLEHRTSVLSMIAAYTYSKQMDVASSVAGLSGDAAGWAGPQDSHNIPGDYSPGDFNVGQRLAISGVYALPVGRGKTILPHVNRLVDEAIGGWQLATIALFQGGLPFSVVASDIGGSVGTFGFRADQHLPKPPAGFHRSNTSWFSSSSAHTDTNPNAQYTQPVPGLLGSASRNTVKGPGQIDDDFSLFKNFAIYESLGLQFRVDAFNAFNHYNPGQPDNNINDSNAGVIQATNQQRDARILQASVRLTF